MPGSDHERLLKGGDAFLDFVEGGHAEVAHTLAGGDFSDFHGAAAGDDDLANFVGDGHGFDDGASAGVTGVVTAFASAAAIKGDSIEVTRRNAQIAEHLRRVT